MDHPLINLALAIAIGALIGIDREQRKREEDQHGVGGLRTFMLYGLLGGLSAFVSIRLQSPILFGVGLLTAAAIVLLARFRQARCDPDQFGLTTDTAMIVVYLLGGLAMMDERVLAVAIGIGVAAILAFKERLHGWVERIGRDDLYAVLKLLIASGIVLPLLPNRTIDPWQVFNPYKIWWLVILLSAVSLVGYVLTRLLGAGRGAALTGLVGGLASSTAVSLTFAKRSTQEQSVPGIAAALASGVLLAWVVMFARVIIIAGVIHVPLFRTLAWSMGLMGLAAMVMALVNLRNGETGTSDAVVPVKNPFSLWSAIKFGAVFSGVIIAVDLARRFIPAAGLYAVAALAGLTDVDAITLSMSELAKDNAMLPLATMCIVIAVMVNTLVKLGFVVVLGSAAMRKRMVLATTIVIAAGTAALLVERIA